MDRAQQLNLFLSEAPSQWPALVRRAPEDKPEPEPRPQGAMLQEFSIRRLALVSTGETRTAPAATPLARPALLAAFFLPFLEDRPQETLLALHMDAQFRPLCLQMVGIGTANRISVGPGPIFRAALLCGASSVAIAHNHPSGDPSPSAEDILFTRRVQEAGDVLGVNLVDHVIVGEMRAWRSLRQQGAFLPPKSEKG